MQDHALTLPRASLVDAVLPDVRFRNAVVVMGGALLVAALAQIRIPLGFTPVPLTGQTFGVALVGAGLGARRGMAALALYVLLGALGLPFYAGGEAGWTHVFGSTGGYLIGFIFAAWLIGRLTERGLDRKPWTAFLLFQLGSVVVLGCGVAGLMLTLDLSLGTALRLGWLPFIPGDLIKTAVAAGLFPSAWLLVKRYTQNERPSA